MKKCNEVWGPLMAGEEYDKQTLADYFAELSRDIAAQKQRVGGDWAVATVVFSREIRDMMRSGCHVSGCGVVLEKVPSEGS